MKIFLANAPWRKQGFYGVRAGSRWPHFEKDASQYMPFPFFLAYATSLLRKNGFTPLLVDAIAEDIDDESFLSRIKSFKPDVIFFEISSISLNTDITMLQKVRQLTGDTTCIVFGGAHHTLGDPAFLVEHAELDFAISGEYEFPLLYLMQALRDGSSLESIPALARRINDYDIHITPRSTVQPNLDDFPWPARDMLPMERYNDRPGGIPAPSLQLLASRGCPFGCIFCAWPQLMYGGKSYRTRSPATWWMKSKHVSNVSVLNPFISTTILLTLERRRILSLCHEIKERNLGLPWAVMARADQMDRELLVTLKDAGLTALKYGVESGSQDILKMACKDLNLSKVMETVRITRELGIHYHLTFMLGLPGETTETARQTIDLALELDPDSLQLSIATPFPGSRFHNMLLEKGHLVSTNPDQYDGYHNSVVRTDALTHEEIIDLRNEAEEIWKNHCEQRRNLSPKILIGR